MKARGKTYLNQSIHEGGAIMWEIKTGADKDYRGGLVEGCLRIYDCSQSIHLDFDIDDAKQLKNRISKLETLISELNKMKEALDQVKPSTKFYY